LIAARKTISASRSAPSRSTKSSPHATFPTSFTSTRADITGSTSPSTCPHFFNSTSARSNPLRIPEIRRDDGWRSERRAPISDGLRGALGDPGRWIEGLLRTRSWQDSIRGASPAALPGSADFPQGFSHRLTTLAGGLPKPGWQALAYMRFKSARPRKIASIRDPVPSWNTLRPEWAPAQVESDSPGFSLVFSISRLVSRLCPGSAKFGILLKKRNPMFLLISSLHYAYNSVFRPRPCERRSPRRSSP